MENGIWKLNLGSSVAAFSPSAVSWETYTRKLTHTYTLTSNDFCACLSVGVVTYTPDFMGISMANPAPQASLCTFLTPFSER